MTLPQVRSVEAFAAQSAGGLAIGKSGRGYPTCLYANRAIWVKQETRRLWALLEFGARWRRNPATLARVVLRHIAGGLKAKTAG
jgi:hypothetical protein